MFILATILLTLDLSTSTHCLALALLFLLSIVIATTIVINFFNQWNDNIFHANVVLWDCFHLNSAANLQIWLRMRPSPCCTWPSSCHQRSPRNSWNNNNKTYEWIISRYLTQNLQDNQIGGLILTRDGNFRNDKKICHQRKWNLHEINKRICIIVIWVSEVFTIMSCHIRV